MKLSNKHRLLPIGRLKRVTIYFYGVRTMEYFELIDIVDGTTPYPSFLLLRTKHQYSVQKPLEKYSMP
jgi:hypothetical protein